MIPKSGHRFSDRIMRNESMIPKSGDRFPAFAKPASAGEGRSDKIMRKRHAR